MKTQMMKCVAVLGAICLVIAALLATVNYITAPIIADQAKRAQEKAIRAVLPDATEIVKVDLTDEVPSSVKEIYRDAGGSGYAFVIHAAGYGGAASPIIATVGIDMTRSIIKISVTDVSGETPGVGDKVQNSNFLDAFVGRDSVEGIATISGASISSEGFIAGVADAFTAFNAVAEFVETDAQKIARLVYDVLPGMNSKIGYATVTLPASAPASVSSALRAKNSTGYAVVVGEGADTMIIGLNSYLKLHSAINLDGEAVTPSEDQLNDAIAAVTADNDRYQNNYLTVVGRVTTGVASRLDTYSGAPVSLFNAYSIEGDASVAFVFLMQSSSDDGAIVYAVSVSAGGDVVTVLPISPAGASADGFDLTADVASAYQQYHE